MSIGALSLLRSDRNEQDKPLDRGRSDAARPRRLTTEETRASSTLGLHPSMPANASKGANARRGTTMVADKPPTREVDDVELIQRFQSGDEDGFVELYVRRQAEIYTYCLRLSEGDKDLASDIFQETFVKVWRKADQFREGTNVLGWLYTIAKTTWLNHKRRRIHDSIEEERHAMLPVTDRTMQPEFGLEQNTLREKVEGAIQKLTVELREPFCLREFDGYSYQEISEMLHITMGATRQRIYRAKQALREYLWEFVHDDEGIIATAFDPKEGLDDA